jgi:hypothetical protein
MGQPTSGEIRVSTDAMHVEAGVWFTAAGELQAAAARARALVIDHYDSTVFREFIEEHNAAVDQVAALCRSGYTQLNDVGFTLGDVADTYQAEEDANLHAMDNLY